MPVVPFAVRNVAPGALRFVTLNLWGAQAPLDRRLDRAAEGLADLAPDVIALQEVQQMPGLAQTTAETLARRLGLVSVFAPAVAFRGGHEGLAIISRPNIETHEVLELPYATVEERRILLSVRISTTSGPLWVHTTHLNYRPNHGRQREDQVLAIADSLASRTPDNPQILMGDFNATPEADEIRWLKGLTTIQGRRVHFQDAWEAAGDRATDGLTWARRNPGTDALAFLGQDRRLDYIFVTTRRKDGRGLISQCQVALDGPDSQGLFPSDHFAVVADVQIAPMAVPPGSVS